MLKDVFYFGDKPNAHPRERFAPDLETARKLSTTDHFWVINSKCDYKNFDWEWDADFLPDEEVWTGEHINIWPSQWQKDSGTWCVYKYNEVPYKVYRADVDPVPYKREAGEWKIIHDIDPTTFDFSWHPDPTDPPFIYVFGNHLYSAQKMPTLEYHVEGATERKYVSDLVPTLASKPELFEVYDKVIDFDYTWRPDPDAPPIIYVWGTQQHPATVKPVVIFRAEGINEMTEVYPYEYNEHTFAKLAPAPELFVTKHEVVNFDYTWRPDPNDPPFIYVWGNKHVPGEIGSTVEFHVEGATRKKFVNNDVQLKIKHSYWKIVQKIDETKFDLSWIPDPTSPPYIYIWGNKWIPAELKSTIEYHVEGATERKYMEELVEVLPEEDRWTEIQNIDKNKFDMSWRPDPREPAYIYAWGNKWIAAELQPSIVYAADGATEYKYMDELVEVLPDDNWSTLLPIDVNKFDFTWRPDPREPAYIYVWGNQHNSAEIEATVKYTALGATDFKFMSETIEVLPDSTNWTEVQLVDKTKFDYSWRPDPSSPPYIYVWGNKWIPAELQPTIVYAVPGASEYKYMEELVEVLPEEDRWTTIIPIDDSTFDMSWRPDPREPAYIYVWGNQHNSAEKEPTIQYVVPGATDYKYMHDEVAYVLKDDKNWEVLLPVSEFDFSWRPDPGSPPYVYVWGNQWHDSTTEPTVVYTVPGATDFKYMTEGHAKVSPMHDNWETLLPIDKFDYSWRPHPHSPPYVYVFGNQWHDCRDEPTVVYTVPGATEYNYVEDIVAYVKGNPADPRWERLLSIVDFDYSWRPHPHSPPYIYIFGNKWNDAETEPTIVYNVKDASEYKFMDKPIAMTAAHFENWSVTNNDDMHSFDFSWRPNPHSPPMIYQWPNNGPRYTVPGGTNVINMEYTEDMKPRSWKTTDYDGIVVQKYFIKSTLEELVALHPDEFFWALNPDLNYDDFDFNWTPEKDKERFVNVFGNEQSKDIQTYFINGPAYTLGYRDNHYVEATGKVVSNLSMFFVDRGNSESQERFERLKQRLPRLQKTRFLNTWVDTINRCVNKAETSLFWVLNSELDYTGFDFDYYPSTWQAKMVHVFGTQWSHWGNTYLINRDTFFDDSKYIKLIEHLSVLNFVKSKTAVATNCLYDVVLVDHGNKNQSSEIISRKINGKSLSTVAYRNSYLETFKEMLKTLPKLDKEHYIWICSSVCDYSTFDFTYICDPFAKEQLHVFPSDGQKFGDTFLVNVNKLRELITNMEKLEDYEKINYNNQQRAKRLTAPSIITQEDTHFKSIHTEFDFPYATFTTYDQEHLASRVETEPMSLWSPEHKNIIIGSKGGSTIVVPKEASEIVKRELYDYPYIKKSARIVDSKPLDIVFISNGEACADSNYEHLLDVAKGKANKITRIDGINGRVQAYHAAANASETPWFLAVFAKLMVNPMFDFNWQPDRLQVPKHYIFNATNAVNGLCYGHQAMIAYNKRLTLGNLGRGLDFTLDDTHESVDIDSGMALFNTDPYSTWRTSFREAIKLKVDVEDHGSDISKQRLDTWLTVGDGDHGRWSTLGASDAIDFYNEVDGDIFELRDSYEWDWLKSRFDGKYAKYFDKK
jgi:hypothetical protein